MEEINNTTILYIEDDEITKEQISIFLQSQCKKLYTASNGQEGYELFIKYKPDIIITDIEMPKLNGIDMLKKVRKVSLSTQMIIISAYIKPQYLLEAVNLQLTQYIIKPISLEKIIDALKLSSNFLDCGKIDTLHYFAEDIYYDSYTKELFSKDINISLSKYERVLIELFIKKHPEPTSYEMIDNHIYNGSSSKNAIKLLIGSLKKKISKESILNISGYGYKLNIIGKK